MRKYDWSGPSPEDLKALDSALAFAGHQVVMEPRWTGATAKLYGMSPPSVNLGAALEASVKYPWGLQTWEETTFGPFMVAGSPQQWSAEFSWLPLVNYATLRYIRLGFKPGLYRG